MVQLTDIDIFIIYLIPSVFLIASWIWESIVDKSSLVKTIALSTIAFTFLNIISSFIILGKPYGYLLISFVIWAFLTVTFFLFELKKEGSKAMAVLIIGYGAMVAYQYYKVIDYLFY